MIDTLATLRIIICERGGGMHERERHRIILSAVQGKPVATVGELVELTGVSEATVRRDIAALHVEQKLRRVRGGAEALHPPQRGALAGRPFAVNDSLHVAEKTAIAREAAALCEDDDDIIVNGGTTTFRMVPLLSQRRVQVLTNSFPVAAHLLEHSQNDVAIVGGAIYREQNIVLSPGQNDAADAFCARRMFMGAHSIGRHGLMESDPLVLQSERRLMERADELVVLADSSKFDRRSSLVLCPLERIDILVTDEGISDKAITMLEAADVRIVIARTTDSQLRSTG